MDVKLTLPDEVVAALGREPEREVLEGVLLLLVSEGKISLERAAAVLGFGGHEEAARWYADRTSSRQAPETEGDDLIGEIVHFEDLTQEDLDKLDRFLDITPAEKGSGLSDVSIEHDKYLYEDG